MTGRPTRRSFLTQVAGGAFLMGGGLALTGAASGTAQNRPGAAPKKQDMLVDSDPSDPARPVPQPRLRPQFTRPSIATTPSPPDRPIDPPGPGGPVQRFVVCPGNVRCPRRGQ